MREFCDPVDYFLLHLTLSEWHHGSHQSHPARGARAWKPAGLWYEFL